MNNFRKTSFFFRFIIKATSALIAFLLLIILTITIFLFFNKEKIKERLNKPQNEIINYINFDAIKINPFINFPNISIAIKGVKMEKHTEGDNPSKTNLANLENLYLEMALFSLIKQDLHISGIHLKNGNINLHQLQGKESDFINLINSLSSDSTKHESGSRFDLLLDNLSIKNIKINYLNLANNKQTSLQIEALRTSIFSSSDSIKLKLQSKLHLDEILAFESFHLRNLELNIDTDCKIDKLSSIVEINRANLTIDESAFNLSGTYAYGDNQLLDLKYSLDGNGMFAKRGYKNIEHGKASIQGTLRHNFIHTNPTINLNYNLNDIDIIVPESKQIINKLNLKGSFKSGIKDGRLYQHLLCDTIYADIDNGYLNGKIEIDKHHQTSLTSILNAKINIDHFDKLFNTKIIKNLQGDISIQMNLNDYMLDDSLSYSNNNYSDISFDSIQFKVPALKTNCKLNGIISGQYDSLTLKDLKLKLGNTDLKLNGNINNMVSINTLKTNIDINNLYIESNRFDLPEFVDWLPNSRPGFHERFGHNIINAKLFTNINIVLDKDKNLSKESFIFVHVISGKGTIDSLLPPMDLSEIHMNVSKHDSTKCITFTELNIAFDTANISGELNIYTNPNKSDSLKFNVNLSQLNPNSLFSYYKIDSPQNKKILQINGDIESSMAYNRLDRTKKFDFLKLNINKLNAKLPSDTIDIRNLKLNLDTIEYKKELLATLTTQAKLFIGEIQNNMGYMNNFSTDIHVDDGVYSINNLTSKTLLKNGQGSFIFAPFKSDSYYNIDYKIDDLSINDLFAQMHSEAIMEGSINTKIDIKTNGLNKSEKQKNTNGSFVLEGQNILLHGLDLDKTIKKLESRSYFNLFDVAGVIVGFAAATGIDSKSYLKKNSDDSETSDATSNISEIIADYSIVNGKISINDLAFSTTENRIAVKGYYNLLTDSLQLMGAIVDSTGRPTWHQSISGTSKNQKLDSYRPIKTLLKPISKIVKGVFNVKDDVFYEGSVEHPK